MSIFSKFFKKRHPTEVSSGDLKVVLKTDKDLSEEQKNAIITIVKDGIMSGADLSDIVIKMMMSTGIYDVVVLNRTKDGIEVLF